VNDVVCPDGCDIEKISHQSVQEVYLLRQRVINVGKGESRLSFNIHVDVGTELSVPVIISYYGLKEQ
jgi:hypothetical protein